MGQASIPGVKVALDSNVLIYAEGVDGGTRMTQAQDAIRAVRDSDLVLPVQALGEMFAVLTRKHRWSRSAARAAVLTWSDSYPLIGTGPGCILAAMDLAATHGLQIWDAVILAAAAEAGCGILLSEDMQHGFAWRGVAVQNPFAGH